MQLVPTLRLLSFPGAFALATAVSLACTEGVPSAPDQAPPIAAAAGGRPPFVDDDGKYYCKANYSLAYSGSTVYSSYDLNQNGYICEYNKGASTGKPLIVDDDGNQGCPKGYGPAYLATGDYGEVWDFNGKKWICVLIPK